MTEYSVSYLQQTLVFGDGIFRRYLQKTAMPSDGIFRRLLCARGVSLAEKIHTAADGIFRHWAPVCCKLRWNIPSLGTRWLQVAMEYSVTATRLLQVAMEYSVTGHPLAASCDGIFRHWAPV